MITVLDQIKSIFYEFEAIENGDIKTCFRKVKKWDSEKELRLQFDIMDTFNITFEHSEFNNCETIEDVIELIVDSLCKDI